LNVIKGLFQVINKHSSRLAILSSLGLVLFYYSWRFCLGSALIFIIGIGDGYPTPGMMVIGWVILISYGTIMLSVAVGFIASIYFLLRDVRIPRQKKTYLLGGITCWFYVAAFGGWIARADDAAKTAIMEGDFHAYQRAAKRRLNGNINDDLWLSARWGRKEFVEALLKRGADPNARFGGSGSSIMEAAAENLADSSTNVSEVIRLLVAHGATNQRPQFTNPRAYSE
jgi:hypothetical protein